MPSCKITGTFTYTFKNGKEAELSYEAIIYGTGDHRADDVVITPAEGEEIPEASLESEQDAMERVALDLAYIQFRAEF